MKVKSCSAHYPMEKTWTVLRVQTENSKSHCFIWLSNSLCHCNICYILLNQVYYLSFWSERPSDKHRAFIIYQSTHLKRLETHIFTTTTTHNMWKCADMRIFIILIYLYFIVNVYLYRDIKPMHNTQHSIYSLSYSAMLVPRWVFKYNIHLHNGFQKQNNIGHRPKHKCKAKNINRSKTIRWQTIIRCLCSTSITQKT